MYKQRSPPDELHGILEDCARLRGCYPLMNRINSQFFEWLMTEKRHYLTPFAEEFYNHCIMEYATDKHKDAMQELAQNPTSFHPVYYCPQCNEIVTNIYTDNTITGVWPKCTKCNSLLQWHYERE